MISNLWLRFPAFIQVIFLLSACFVIGWTSVGSCTIKAAPGQIVSGELILKAATPDEISIRAPGSILGWAIDRAQSINTRQGTLVVNATGGWVITVSTDAVSGGFQSEYDTATSQYVQAGKKLNTAMIIRAENGNEVDLTKGGVLVVGSGNKAVPVTFEQKITADDKPLPQGRDYRISLTYKASPVL
jgi:hypothetical protein